MAKSCGSFCCSSSPQPLSTNTRKFNRYHVSFVVNRDCDDFGALRMSLKDGERIIEAGLPGYDIFTEMFRTTIATGSMAKSSTQRALEDEDEDTETRGSSSRSRVPRRDVSEDASMGCNSGGEGQCKDEILRAKGTPLNLLEDDGSSTCEAPSLHQYHDCTIFNPRRIER
ncbi:hypothetical protein BUALT_Bualt01G0195200 [Buddleja alternifolia]|uniref:Uncharacterized protein n=1 Tax=Buddleja alternifolia TaxID=168488 RepID=A0AAV6YIX4_9LAMI|nr:hypothetical protein BUALT_Bualt01G0195200 [Buddleja alternifolia]